MKNKIFIAEALGTFALSLVVAVSLKGGFPVVTPVIAAIVLGLFVYSIGHISGTHMNPAVTIGLWSIGKIKQNDAILYIIAQFIGAGLAMYLAKYSINDPRVITSSGNWIFLAAEALGTFFFTFGIASVVYGKTPAVASGAVVGGSLLFGIVVSAFFGTNGILNPAVALTIGSFSYIYILGPIIGAVAGMNVYKYLEEK